MWASVSDRFLLPLLSNVVVVVVFRGSVDFCNLVDARNSPTVTCLSFF